MKYSLNFCPVCPLLYIYNGQTEQIEQSGFCVIASFDTTKILILLLQLKNRKIRFVRSVRVYTQSNYELHEFN